MTDNNLTFRNPIDDKEKSALGRFFPNTTQLVYLLVGVIVTLLGQNIAPSLSFFALHVDPEVRIEKVIQNFTDAGKAIAAVSHEIEKIKEEILTRQREQGRQINNLRGFQRDLMTTFETLVTPMHSFRDRSDKFLEFVEISNDRHRNIKEMLGSTLSFLQRIHTKNLYYVDRITLKRETGQ